ncbi:hypothetical protein LINGRAHAP2_LOCUS5475 [Linum grandiflorum]
MTSQHQLREEPSANNRTR